MMKKFTHVKMLLFMLLPLCLLGCNDNDDNFPKNYVGFKHPTHSVNCDKTSPESEVEITFIAMEKLKEDRVMELSTPKLSAGQPIVAQLTEQKVTMKAGQKSTTTMLKIFPSRMVLKQHNVTLYCVPQWKEGSKSQMIIQLKQP